MNESSTTEEDVDELEDIPEQMRDRINQIIDQRVAWKV